MSTDRIDNLGKYRAALDGLISYLERLGICVAALAGSAAIIHFREQIFSIAPWFPAIIGAVALLGSFFLTVWVAADQYTRVPTGKSRFWSVLAAAAVLVPSLLFVLGGLYAALKGFAP
jgi:hypothetical protein